MALYAGETVLIAATAADFDDEALTDDDITAMTAKVFDSESDVTLEEVSMIWSPEDARWEYRWNTGGVEPGTYRVRVTAVGPEDIVSWEYKRFRLARDPLAEV